MGASEEWEESQFREFIVIFINKEKKDGTWSIKMKNKSRCKKGKKENNFPQ